MRLTPRPVEIFLKGERIAAHLRASGNHRHTTVSEHMPSSHRRYADRTVERIRREAASIGPATAALCELMLERRPTLSRASSTSLRAPAAPALSRAAANPACAWSASCHRAPGPSGSIAARMVAALPDEVGDAAAATLPVAGLWRRYFRSQYPATAGNTVWHRVAWGAPSSVSAAACQATKCGAARCVSRAASSR